MGRAVALLRVHYQGFAESSLVIETVYFVGDQDYHLYMDIQEAINLAILERFGAEGIQFAFPTLHIVGEARPEESSR